MEGSRKSPDTTRAGNNSDEGRSVMAGRMIAALTGLTIVASTVAASAKPMPDVNGVWKPVTGSDDRLMTIKLLNDRINIEATDLSCELTDLQIDEGSSITANSECSDESFTIYAKETLTVLPIDQ